MRVAALVKQIPSFEEMRLGDDGRLVRDGLPLEMSAYCRRAVAQAVALASGGGRATVVTLGPPAAVDVLREALAYGSRHGVEVDAVHLCDPELAGSDTLATARALVTTIERLEQEGGPFDLVLAGRASVDADTGQVPPQVAELLDRPFATGVKRLDLVDGGGAVRVGCEHDDGWVEATVALPAVLSTAERLIDPCKLKDPAEWVDVAPGRIRTWTAGDLGRGPWGAAGSPTTVGEVRTEATDRAGVVLDGPLDRQVADLLDALEDRGALVPGRLHDADEAPVPAARPEPGPTVVAVVVERDRARLARELLGAAARVAEAVDGRVVAVGEGPLDAAELSTWGADAGVALTAAGPPSTDGAPALAEEDVATALADWVDETEPWAVIGPGTVWGREVLGRTAAATASGLTGDAVGLAVDGDRLVGWKPAFGGTLVAAVRAVSKVQMATVRAGVLPVHPPRSAGPVPLTEREVAPRGRVVVHDRWRDDDLDDLARAELVIGVGRGVDPARYAELAPLQARLGAELAATRKVTDAGDLPHARQVGITGRSISPRLFLALGTSGKFNHTVGIRSAGTVVAVNPDPDAPIFGCADYGIVASWDDVVTELDRQLAARSAPAATAR